MRVCEFFAHFPTFFFNLIAIKNLNIYIAEKKKWVFGQIVIKGGFVRVNIYDTKRSGVPVQIIETGEIFNSIQACADKLGVGASWVNAVTNSHTNVCTCHGYHIIRLDSDSYISKKKHVGRPSIPVRIPETGKQYSSITECAKAVNGSTGAISEILCKKGVRKTHKGFHYEYAASSNSV